MNSLRTCYVIKSTINLDLVIKSEIHFWIITYETVNSNPKRWKAIRLCKWMLRNFLRSVIFQSWKSTLKTLSFDLNPKLMLIIFYNSDNFINNLWEVLSYVFLDVSVMWELMLSTWLWDTRILIVTNNIIYKM